MSALRAGSPISRRPPIGERRRERAEGPRDDDGQREQREEDIGQDARTASSRRVSRGGRGKVGRDGRDHQHRDVSSPNRAGVTRTISIAQTTRKTSGSPSQSRMRQSATRSCRSAGAQPDRRRRAGGAGSRAVSRVRRRERARG